MGWFGEKMREEGPLVTIDMGIWCWRCGAGEMVIIEGDGDDNDIGQAADSSSDELGKS